MNLDRENGAAITAFAISVFTGFLFFGDAEQVIFRIAASSLAAGVALGAAGWRGWRRLTLSFALPAFLVSGFLATIVRGAFDPDYRQYMAATDRTWLPILAIFFGLPAFLTFLSADALSLAVRRKTLKR